MRRPSAAGHDLGWESILDRGSWTRYSWSQLDFRSPAMARRTARPQPDQTLELPALTRTCPACGGPLWAAYKTQRSVTTLTGTVRLRLQVRRCRDPHCPRRGVPLRPEQEGRLALPEHEFGLDVIATIGTLRYSQHRSVPEIHAELTRRGVPIWPRSVTNLREAAKPIYEADRHAKKELKKRVRGVRPIERKLEGRDDEQAKVIRRYCAAVRSSLTDDGRPPLSAPGLLLKGRLEAVVESLD